ncbi:MAG: NADH:flavin oxidoreductase [Solobacterium sp.]|nr:NADH:flavin oxidoreductase [Solobacterium sp.]MCH4222542.1 NADH:flavin oxidoreductase [Solobacterium sp.]MCH4265474.1 NADH:flavin oxidoreductase [Solobacterium sp.]
MSESIASPINYGGLELKNRIIFAPTSMGLKQEEYDQKLTAIADGGCAMIIIGDVPVSRKGFGSLYSAQGIKHYTHLIELIHAHGCKVCAQLHQSDTVMKGMLKYIPQLITHKISQNDLRRLMNDQTGPYITNLPIEKVKAITASFGDAAVQAMSLGFDMIQIHGDRMCGSFSSTVFNRRTDEYGGSAENRARFAIESIQAVRKALPEVPIDYKLAVRQENPHYGNAGVLEEEIPVFVPLLVNAGVTSFHVTLANHSNLSDTIPPRNHPEFHDEGCFLKFSDEVRKVTSVPICGVGALTDPAFVEQQIASGRIDCAAMSRQLIADPAWPDKVIHHKADTIHPCIRCNSQCLNGMMQHKGVHCIYEGGKQS